MFRAIKSDKLNSGSIVKNVNRRIEIPVDTARIGHQSHAFSFQSFETTVLKDLDSRLYDRTGSLSCTAEQSQAYDYRE